MYHEKKLKETIYTSEDSISFLKVLKKITTDLPMANQLGYQLFKRDIKSLYRQSALGFLWAFIPPLVTAAIWILLNGSNVVAFKETNIPFPVYVLLGTLLWQILTESINQPLKSAVQSRSILIKLNFPREALIINAFYTVLFNATLKLLVIFIVLFLFHIKPGLSILYFPFYFSGLIMLGLSIGIILIPFGMLFQDISKGLPIFMQFLMYLTPVIYLEPTEGILAKLNQYNIFSFFLQGSRNTLTLQQQDLTSVSISIWIGSFIFLILGVIIYRFVMPIIVERAGS